jgi:hypothetical protein
MQEKEQPSPLTLFPSSHCSVPSMAPFPQVELSVAAEEE